MAATEEGITILFSSHVVAELERFCDYLIILLDGRVRVAGDVDELLAAHRVMTSANSPDSARDSVRALARDDDRAREAGVVAVTRGGTQTTMIVRRDAVLSSIGWDAHAVTLEELVLAYMANPSESLILPSADGEQESGSAANTEKAGLREERVP